MIGTLDVLKVGPLTDLVELCYMAVFLFFSTGQLVYDIIFGSFCKFVSEIYVTVNEAEVNCCDSLFSPATIIHTSLGINLKPIPCESKLGLLEVLQELWVYS